MNFDNDGTFSLRKSFSHGRKLPRSRESAHIYDWCRRRRRCECLEWTVKLAHPSGALGIIQLGNALEFLLRRTNEGTRNLLYFCLVFLRLRDFLRLLDFFGLHNLL